MADRTQSGLISGSLSFLLVVCVPAAFWILALIGAFQLFGSDAPRWLLIAFGTATVLILTPIWASLRVSRADDPEEV